MHDVVLKVIPKKKVKRNKERGWSEMQVLQGLNYPNIMCLVSLPHAPPLFPCHDTHPSSFVT